MYPYYRPKCVVLKSEMVGVDRVQIEEWDTSLVVDLADPPGQSCAVGSLRRVVFNLDHADKAEAFYQSVISELQAGRDSNGIDTFGGVDIVGKSYWF